MSHSSFSISAIFTNFCPFQIDLSGNTVWPQDVRWHFWWTFVHSKVKNRSLPSQCWMRLFCDFQTQWRCKEFKNSCNNFAQRCFICSSFTTDDAFLTRAQWCALCNVIRNFWLDLYFEKSFFCISSVIVVEVCRRARSKPCIINTCLNSVKGQYVEKKLQFYVKILVMERNLVSTLDIYLSMKLIAVFKVIFVLKNSEIRKKVDFLSFCDICEKNKKNQMPKNFVMFKLQSQWLKITQIVAFSSN